MSGTLEGDNKVLERLWLQQVEAFEKGKPTGTWGRKASGPALIFGRQQLVLDSRAAEKVARCFYLA